MKQTFNIEKCIVHITQIDSDFMHYRKEQAVYALSMYNKAKYRLNFNVFDDIKLLHIVNEFDLYKFVEKAPYKYHFRLFRNVDNGILYLLTLNGDLYAGDSLMGNVCTLIYKEKAEQYNTIDICNNGIYRNDILIECEKLFIKLLRSKQKVKGTHLKSVSEKELKIINNIINN